MDRGFKFLAVARATAGEEGAVRITLPRTIKQALSVRAGELLEFEVCRVGGTSE